jgi:hypothetical protein
LASAEISIGSAIRTVPITDTIQATWIQFGALAPIATALLL